MEDWERAGLLTFSCMWDAGSQKTALDLGGSLPLPFSSVSSSDPGVSVFLQHLAAGMGLGMGPS
jgi:hypothetical protein